MGHSETYEEVLDSYVDYVVKHYGNDSIVVSDGYQADNISIKSYERYRRSTKNLGQIVAVINTGDTVPMKQEKFLFQTNNKDLLVKLIMEKLEAARVKSKQASEDADRLIVMTAIEEKCIDNPSAIIGNDVDLLDLMTALTPTNRTVYFIKKGKLLTDDKLYASNDYVEFKRYILTAHCLSGYDTTSYLYRRGKISLFKLLEIHEV